MCFWLYFFFFVFFLKDFFWSMVFLILASTVVLLKSSMNFFYPFFFDEVSFFLVILSFFIMVVTCFSSFFHIKEVDYQKYFLLCSVIFLVLLFLFSVQNYLVFLVCFEFIMIPMVFMISYWSSQADRLVANYYFFFYAVVGAMPLLISVMYVLKLSNFFFLFGKFFSMSVEFCGLFVLVLVLMAFLCKLPMYGLHIWLPKAHVEAPVGGSMILAGLLLKMSGYGVLRFFSFFFCVSVFGKYVFLALLVLGMVMPMFICFRQVDLKCLIAYSSVSHMSVSLLSLFFYNFYSFLGGLVVFLSHSVISPMMFWLGNLLYERSGTRLVLSYSSLEMKLKSLFMLFVLSFVCNMGYPPFVSFFSELCLYLGMLSESFFMVFFFFVFVLVSSVVMMYCVVMIFKGSGNGFFKFGLSFREYLVSSLFCWCLGGLSFIFCLFF